MTTPYTVDDSSLTVALNEAHERIKRAEERLTRIACAHIAAAVRDILTDHHPDPDAPFDAAHLRLILLPLGTVEADGTYWTTTGEARRLSIPAAGYGAGDVNGWAHQLNDYNRDIWMPLCQSDTAPDGTIAYRLDLAQAVALPPEIQNMPRMAEIRDRLTAAARNPWYIDPYAWDRHGALVADDDPAATHTDFHIMDAEGLRVAEVSVNHEPGDSDDPTADLAVSRASAEFIAQAPQDLAYVMAYLEHLGGGEDAALPHLHSACGHCGTQLYTSAVSETPTALDGSTRCGNRSTWLGLPRQHLPRP
ncbi:hypothetical protein [Streptomyces violascens]|uniref:hypothetical protein n=1 Tax=Streptomyces violascens TaxID=67381 RepID=UPI00167831A5|nr:hypothetical protein [Streptomyces violascens]GGU49500.1 hypothetical protein GCM10010289_82530 [Streptomyces violascens]